MRSRQDSLSHCKSELVGVNAEKKSVESAEFALQGGAKSVESAEFALQGGGPCCAPDWSIAPSL
jgi:hypothetical protein